MCDTHPRDELADESLPSPLQASIPQGSYPTHLEISASQMDTVEFTKRTSVRTDNPNNDLKQQREEDRPMAEEEEAMFFSFVILHAEEDMDMAERFRERLESVSIGKGATFSDEFAIPGKNTLMCVEDAIDNSAFTILLLTRNFNTRLLEVETNSALINSINNKHKYNSVIPLLPVTNGMPQDRMPKVLQTLVPLQENQSFDRKAKKTFNTVSIERQRKVWAMEQRVKEKGRELERLQLAKKHALMIREVKEMEIVENREFRTSKEDPGVFPIQLCFDPVERRTTGNRHKHHS
ncbi:TIR domain-containing adapter molecule 1 [Aplochiton taeniatus]